MGWRPRIYFQWPLCGLVLLLAIYGSAGSVSHFLVELSKQSHVSPIGRRSVLQTTDRTASTGIDTRLQPFRMLAPSMHPSNGPVKLGFDVSSSPKVPPMVPNVEQRAHSPAHPVSPIPSPRGFSNVLPPKFEAAPPTIQAAKPPLPASAPSEHASVEHKHQIIISPSTQGQASEVPSAQDLSPSSVIPPVAQIRKGMPRVGEKTPTSSPPITVPSAPVSSPPERFPTNPDIMKVPPSMMGPSLSPSSATPPAIPGKRYGIPVAAPPKEISKPLSPVNSSHSKGAFPVTSPAPHEATNPSNTTHAPLISPAPPPQQRRPDSPAPHEAKRHSNATLAPQSPEERLHQSPASSPTVSIHQHKFRKAGGNPLSAPSSHAPLASDPLPPPRRSPQTPATAPTVPIQQRTSRKRVGSPASAPLSPSPPLTYHPGPLFSPSPLSPREAFPKERHRNHALPPHIQRSSLSPTQAPLSSNSGEVAPVLPPSPVIPSTPYESSHSPIPSPSQSTASHYPLLSPSWSFSRNPRAPTSQATPISPPSPPNLGPTHSPIIPPSESFSKNPMTPKAQPLLLLPPPPPNSDCTPLVCPEPLTNSPPGSPCACVFPMKVGLRLSIPLYTFFPLVSELAQEIASGVQMKQSQVRVMGANAASEEPEKTVVLLDLVPPKYTFDSSLAFSAYERFWHKQVPIKASFFGDYDVLYVLYPGLPPSPPMAPADMNTGEGTNGNNGRAIKPLGVDVPKQKDKLSGSLIAIIVISSVVVLFLIVGAAWLLLLRHGDHAHLRSPTPQTSLPPFAKSSGTGAAIFRSQHSSTSASFGSSIAPYKGSAKIFTLAEIERATKRFQDSRIIGEGGFGRVYQGTLEDGTRVAVKVLKRDDHQGGREFSAEIEMLSRLHHRNLVKLIGICTEDIRCLVYELIPNGSVESHLHGVDKETAPLDWSARVKIALGAARGLAYLHEDSSPRVIHRDFKSSNILLEHDYTPKVSDFGLARTALDEGNKHISTQVMGTFGYVAPEYAMTGHLLVKSDVYSYGVVLLELLTGRKPVDMLQPPGQENLVTWTRPLLTSKEGLELIIDPALGTDYPFDSIAKVAAIASMCVQPEVSHRPFMSEVVQALKLVCNEGHEYRGSGSCSQDYSSVQDSEIRISVGLGKESERMLSVSDIFSTSARFTRDASGSFRRHSSSGPLMTGNRRMSWQRDRSLSTGSMSEHGLSLKSVVGLEHGEEWP